MRVCPSCDNTYHDDDLNYCLMCGTALVDGAVQPTVAISGGTEATVVMNARATMVDQKRHGPWFWIGVTIGCIVSVTGATFGAFFLYFMFISDPNEPPKSNRNAKITTPNKQKSKPTPPPITTPSPNEEVLEDPLKADDVISITWETTALDLKRANDETRTFMCPVFGSEFAIFGSDTYAANSSVCTAAVHAGLIDFEEGGEVTIKFRPGLHHYVTTTRNGVTSNMFGSEDLSFIFLEPAN